MDIIDEINGTVITFVDGKRRLSFDLVGIFEIDETQLSSDYASQAAMFAYFSTKLAEAERELARVEFTLEVEYSRADEYHRSDLELNGRKYTEAVVKSLVIRDADYGKAKEHQIKARYDVDLLKAIVNAMRQRADMLISLGANMRQEMGMTGMRINAMDKAVDEVKQKIRERKQ